MPHDTAMTPACGLGFRVVGGCYGRRRLVDWQAALAGHAAGDPRADNTQESYLSAFTFPDDLRIHLAATGTTKGYAAEGLGLASFRESSELEFGCDSAYMLSRSGVASSSTAADLRCLKNRHGEPRDLRLTFDGSLQRFESLDDFGSAPTPAESIAELWDAGGAA